MYWEKKEGADYSEGEEEWNLWDEFEGFILGRSFGNCCGKEIENQG